MGYMLFGDSTESQYTLNMPKEYAATKIAIWTTVINSTSLAYMKLFIIWICFFPFHLHSFIYFCDTDHQSIHQISFVFDIYFPYPCNLFQKSI